MVGALKISRGKKPGPVKPITKKRENEKRLSRNSQMHMMNYLGPTKPVDVHY